MIFFQVIYTVQTSYRIQSEHSVRKRDDVITEVTLVDP